MTQATMPTNAAQAAEALPEGTRVAEFEIRRVLGSGGFGIVYLAWDHALEREVALKEYMPGTLAGRGSGLQVSVRSDAHADTYALGLRSFINEARLLARFDHPALVKVYRFWEDNGTAYMVMPRYVGRTLRQARHAMVVPPGDAACRRVLDALLSALEVLHREGVYHRDIAPDNILLGDDGQPVLLDFGAARRVLGDHTQALTSIMKPHYAPLEQYADTVMRQGPWTDLYALGGTMFYLITGDVPVAAASRALHDDQLRLAQKGARDCSQSLLAAIDWMLALRPAERPQSVQMLRDLLEGRITVPGVGMTDSTAPGVAARGASAESALWRADIDIGAAAADRVASASSEAAGAPHAVTVVQSHAGGASFAPPNPLSAAAPAVPPSELFPQTGPPALIAPTPEAQPADAATVLRGPAGDAAPTASGFTPTAPRATARRWLAALMLMNVLAWWWFTRPDPVVEAAPVAEARRAPAGTAAAPVSIRPATATAPTARAAPADSAASETVLSVMPARAAAPRSVAPVATATTVVGANSHGPTARPAEQKQEPRLPTAPEAALAAGPRERCGERNFLSMLICVKRECEQASLRGHPECVKMRQQEEAQRDRPL